MGETWFPPCSELQDFQARLILAVPQGGRFATKEERVRKRFIIGGLVVAAAAAVSLAMVGIAGSATKGASPLPASSCGSLQYQGSGSPDFIVASDLPLQGSSRSQTIEMTKAIAFELQASGWKAGKYKVGYQSCDDSTASAGKWDPAKCAANAGIYAANKRSEERRVGKECRARWS